MELGPQVRAAREARGWSQEELAQRVGVSAAQISRVESGVRGVSFTLARRLVAELELDPGAALGVAPEVHDSAA